MGVVALIESQVCCLACTNVSLSRKIVKFSNISTQQNWTSPIETLQEKKKKTQYNVSFYSLCHVLSDSVINFFKAQYQNLTFLSLQRDTLMENCQASTSHYNFTAP